MAAYATCQPVPGKGPAAGPMVEAIDHSLKHLTPEDLQAIAVYIKSVPAVATPGVQQAADSFGRARDDLDSIRGTALPKDLRAMTGPQLYDGCCASCHQAQGQGTEGDGLPALFHNASLGHANTRNLVQVLLHGIHRVGADSVMPAFTYRLDDHQIATLSNYLLVSYGNPEAKVTEAQVARLRDPASADPTLLIVARVAMGVILVGVLAIAWWLLRRRRTLPLNPPLM